MDQPTYRKMKALGFPQDAAVALAGGKGAKELGLAIVAIVNGQYDGSTTGSQGQPGDTTSEPL